ncbi:MAG TPA: AAA family ATPase, partial [Mycobacteriales bacterium]
FDAAGTKIELRLGDPAESLVGRTRAAGLPDLPGRGLLADGTVCQLAVPDGPPRSPRRTAPVRVLPTTIVAPQAQGDGAFLLGVGGATCDPVAVDLLAPGRHLVVAGDAGSGRTTVLRRLVTHLGAVADVHVVDPRRTLLVDATSWNHDPESAAGQLRDITRDLRRHLPDPGASPSEIADRTGGPVRSTYVVLDDLDLLADHPLAGAALTDLASLLPYARETGLHLVMVRPAAARTFDPLAARMRAARPWLLQLPGEHLDGPAAGRAAPTLPGRGLLALGTGRAQEVQCYLTPTTAG